jgi:hypothetical protein
MTEHATLHILIRIMPMILEFCPDLSQRFYPIRNLPITRRTSLEEKDESSKQRDDDHHASNQSLIIFDEHKNPHSNLYLIAWQRRFPGGMIHSGAHDSFRLNN